MKSVTTVLGLLFVLVACKTTDQMHVSGFTSYTQSGSSGGSLNGSFVQLLSDPRATGVSCTVAGDTTGGTSAGVRELLPIPTPGVLSLGFFNSATPAPGTQQDLSLTCNLGSCAATCAIPGQFAFAPAPAETLPVGTSLNLSWTESSNAQWYQVWAQCSWYDTTHSSKDTVFTVTSTSAAIPDTWFVRDAWVFVDVCAGNGPSPASSAANGNVTGDARGLWVGLNTIEAQFSVGSLTVAAACRPDDRQWMTPERWLERYNGTGVRR
jgi:hypothetical protein